MDEIELETLLKQDVEKIFLSIFKEQQYILPITAVSRQGEEISKFLEKRFAEYIDRIGHERISDAKASPDGSTKSPYDFCFNYEKENFNDLIWGDIKATNIAYKDSNPDLGTPEKIIQFIMDGHFYILYVFIEYKDCNNSTVKIIQNNEGSFVRCQLLKDIHHSVRINPKPQLQVNIHKPEEYRTKLEFVKLLKKKYEESIQRNIEKQKRKQENLDKRFDNLFNMLHA